MPIQLEITDSQIPLLSKMYSERLGEINKQISKLSEEKLEIEAILKKLHAPKSVSPIEVGVKPISLVRPIKYAAGNEIGIYNPKATIREKIKYVLKTENTEMTSREIVDKLFVLDPALNGDKNKAAKNVSTVLSILVGKGEDFRKKDDKYMLIS